MYIVAYVIMKIMSRIICNLHKGMQVTGTLYVLCIHAALMLQERAEK